MTNSILNTLEPNKINGAARKLNENEINEDLVSSAPSDNPHASLPEVKAKNNLPDPIGDFKTRNRSPLAQTTPPKNLVAKKVNLTRSIESESVSRTDSDDDSHSETLSDDIDGLSENVSDLQELPRQNNSRQIEIAERNIRKEMLIQISQFKTRGYIVGEYNMNSSTESIEIEIGRLAAEQKLRQKMKFFRWFIRGMAWLVEFIAGKLGYDMLEGWNTHVWRNISDYDEYFDVMTRPIYERDIHTGRMVRRENPSLVNRVNVNDELSIVTTFVASAIGYAAGELIDMEKFVGDADDASIGSLVSSRHSSESYGSGSYSSQTETKSSKSK